MGRIFVVVIMLGVGLLLSVQACSGGDLASVKDPGEAAPAGDSTDALTVEAAGNEGQPTRCQVTGTLKSGEQSLKLDLTLQGEDGVLFAGSGTGTLRLEDISLAPNEMREFAAPCYLDTVRPWLPGAYIIRATVTHDGSLNVYDVADTRIYVQAGADGHPRVFSGRDEYSQIYEKGYVAGKHGIHYRIVLDEGPFPNAGTLYLRVTESVHAFAPVMNVKSVGGFQFDHAVYPEHVAASILSPYGVEVVLQPMWAVGERILEIPFVLEEGCMGGTYHLEVVKRNGAGGPSLLAEQAPLTLRVRVDATNPGQPWIEKVIAGEARSIEPSPPLGPVLDKWRQQNDQPASGGATGAGSQAAAPAGSGAEPACCTGGGGETSPAPPADAPAQAAGVTWEMRTGLRGRLWDVYRAEHLNRGGSMPWVAYQRAVLDRNPQLGAGNSVLYPDTVYWLPAPGR